MTTQTINYAQYLGINSVAAAVIFAIGYIPLFAWFILQTIRRPTYVFGVLSLFCLIRITAFIIRSILAGSESAGETLDLYIADQVLFGVGFFGLLYSAFTLVLDRWQLSNAPSDQSAMRITQDRRLFRVVMLVAVILGIIGATKADDTDPENGKTYKIASTVIFLVLTILMAIQALRLTLFERKLGYKASGERSLGGEHGVYILCGIALFLLVREVFATATLGSASKQNNEHLWYPLYALPEILAVMLYATPGLVPPRSELTNQAI
ncbi:hypothetical protein DXG01_000695 [Tephrocybe rancida]|nr:hypothetical protein DXG01_000695 [Tephrocybe rancida]